MTESDSDDRLVELLQDARSDELETVINYQTNAIALSGVEAQEIADSLAQDVGEELGHAEEIGERISVLGGKPRGSYAIEMSQEALQPPEKATDQLSVVEGVIEAESDAVSTYQDLVEAADEEAHLAEFEGFREGLLDE